MKAYEKIIKRLKDCGKEGYLVGGCVRDRLLFKEPYDYDIATNALPEEFAEIFSDFRVIETGIRHGTVTVLCDGESFEVTTYRIDGNYTDGRHPDSVSFSSSLKEDLKRRDFTINAMAMTEDGRVIDPFGGREDLQKGIIRAVGDPQKRFEEDALRILRGVRFAAVLGFQIEEETEKAAYNLLDRVDLVSRERCFAELKKAVCGKAIKETLIRYPRIFAAIVPEIGAMIDYDQKNPHHCHDLLTHTAIAVASTPEQLTLRLAALFHDAGKPQTRHFDELGVAHYFGHAAESAKLAEQRLRTLRSDNRTLEETVFLVKHHDAPAEIEKEQVARKIRKYGIERYEALLLLRRADNLAQAEEYHRIELHDRCEAFAKEIIAENRCFSLRDLTVNGNDLIALGYPKGPQIGGILDHLFNLVFNGELKNERDVLLSYLEIANFENKM